MSHGSDKRKVTTMWNPSILQLTIPVVLAVASAYSIHDRKISVNETKLEALQEEARDNKTHMITTESINLTVRAMEIDIVDMEDRIEKMKKELRDLEFKLYKNHPE